MGIAVHVVDWAAVHRLQALARHLNVMRPYTKDSPVFKMLVAELVEMNNEQRGDFLEFATSKRFRGPPAVAHCLNGWMQVFASEWTAGSGHNCGHRKEAW